MSEDDLSLDDQRFLDRLAALLGPPGRSHVAGANDEEQEQSVLTMLRPLETVLRQSGHPFPEFGALLRVLRWTLGSPEVAARYLGVSTDLLRRFEDGELSPGHFPRSAAAAAARAVATEEQWFEAVATTGAVPGASAPEQARPALPLWIWTAGGAAIALVVLLAANVLADRHRMVAYAVATLLVVTSGLINLLCNMRPATGLGPIDLGRRAASLGQRASAWLWLVGSSVLPAAARSRFGSARAAWRRDATLRFGTWLGLTGIGTMIAGLSTRALGLPWGVAETGLGLMVCLVGYYLGATRDHVNDDAVIGTARGVRNRPGLHRAILGLCLLGLGGFAILTGRWFDPPGPDRALVTLTRHALWIGGSLGAAACVVGFFALAVFHHLRAPRVRRKLLLTWAITMTAGLSCLSYLVAHLGAAAITPDRRLRTAHLVTALMVCIAARQCFHDPWQFSRIVRWGEGRLRLGRPGLPAFLAVLGIRRRLAQAGCVADLSELASSLENLALRLREIGRAEESDAAATEAARLRARLATDAAVDETTAERAESLTNAALVLQALGCGEESAAAAEKAVQIRRRLAEADPSTHLRALTTSLDRLSACLSALGRWDASAVAAEDAVEIRRRLVDADPIANMAELATSLDGLADRQQALGRLAESGATTDEAVELRRRLTEADPARHLPELAASLGTLSLRLAAVGRRKASRAAAEEAVGIYRRLAGEDPSTYRSRLASSLESLAPLRWDMGLRKEGLRAATEADCIRSSRAAA